MESAPGMPDRPLSMTGHPWQLLHAIAGIAWYCIVLHCIVLHGIVLYCMAWCCMVWYSNQPSLTAKALPRFAVTPDLEPSHHLFHHPPFHPPELELTSHQTPSSTTRPLHQVQKRCHCPSQPSQDKPQNALCVKKIALSKYHHLPFLLNTKQTNPTR